MTRRAVYVIQNSSRDQERPTVFIESLKGGEITFGVKASGSSLRIARGRAQAEFSVLRRYVQQIKKIQGAV